MQSHSLEAALEPGFNTSKCGFNIFQDSSCSFACFPADCCRKDAFGWELLDFGSRCCSGSNPRPELVLRGGPSGTHGRVHLAVLKPRTDIVQTLH